MQHVRTGREPALSGAAALPAASGQEPMLGGSRLIALYRAWMLEQIEKPSTTHLRRAAIGDWLAYYGDTRPGTGLRPDGLPDLVWCPVPGGEVLLRDSTEAVRIERFFIARYPVTWAQYRVFLEAEDGHRNPRWWEGLRWRPEYEREVQLVDNQPAQEVSWYDAIAYTRWLSDRLHYEVRLPTEWEWQQAATGGDPENIFFPWGHDWCPACANTRESKLRRSVAVGLYPAGASPVGALDMSGNVLEWCLNRYADPDDITPGGDEPRALRGGSWFLVRRFARTLFRTGDHPFMRFNSVGFRLVTSDPTPRPPEPSGGEVEEEALPEEEGTEQGGEVGRAGLSEPERSA